ncbi:hypothetical protein HDU91_007480 [Kappamyces sp. JEL0680]|nr:hypothetical protein HDU91_007480 [Kappamyces sp. JEL0680]
MSQLADASIKISEFRSIAAKSKQLLKNLRSIFTVLPPSDQEKLKSLMEKVNQDIKELHAFYGRDIDKRKPAAPTPADDGAKAVASRRPSIMRRGSSIALSSPATSPNAAGPISGDAGSAKNEFAIKQWYPRTLFELYSLPYSCTAGITKSEWNLPGVICPIHPLSLLSQLWHSVLLVWLGIFIVLLPLALCYPHYQGWLIPLSLAMMAVIVVDCLIQLRKGYIADQELEMRTDEVWKYHKESKSLLWNLLCAFPYILITQACTEAGSQQRYISNLVCVINSITVIRVANRPSVSWIGERIKIFIQTHEVNNTMVTLFNILGGIGIYWYLRRELTM